MDKRLQKRHKRQVTRAREQVRLSEPDLRTPEQLRAAREASRPGLARGAGALPHYAAPPSQNRSAGSAAKTDA